jgi:hypothetical protein
LVTGVVICCPFSAAVWQLRLDRQAELIGSEAGFRALLRLSRQLVAERAG